ncbi:MAG: hypothetical protein M3O77_05665 [Chloroflexota bacterium]|nr:hypothetical protein [Chloroflexota bacterium]
MTTTQATGPAARRAAAVEPGELAALREIVRLGTTAPPWDELMQVCR